jgi:hypothetical protein
MQGRGTGVSRELFAFRGKSNPHGLGWEFKRLQTIKSSIDVIQGEDRHIVNGDNIRAKELAPISAKSKTFGGRMDTRNVGSEKFATSIESQTQRMICGGLEGHMNILDAQKRIGIHF